MKPYTDILIWENRRRGNKLISFRNMLQEYYLSLIDPERISKQNDLRLSVNEDLREVLDVVSATGASSDVLLSVHDYPFDGLPLDKFRHIQRRLDLLEQAIGVYKKNDRPSLIRTINPIWWLLQILHLPFVVIESIVGSGVRGIEYSLLGKIIKVVVVVLGVEASTKGLFGFTLTGSVIERIIGLAG